MDNSLPNAAPDDSSGGSAELCASLESLEVGGVAPSEGDSVSCKVEGTVSRIDGDNAYIEPEKVNGQDVPSDMKDSSEEESSDPAGDALMKKAMASDAGQGY